MKRYFTRYMSNAKRRPCLLVSPGDLAETANLVFVKREPFLVRALNETAGCAHPDPKEPAHIGGDAQARATLNAAYLAALYAAAGRPNSAAEYARRAKKGLAAYVEMGVPRHSPGYGWLTHLYLVTLAHACDLVWDLAEWPPAQRDALRRMFYANMDDLVRHIHDKHLSNHAAWPMARIATAAALFGDGRLLAKAMDGPDSYCARLAHEFFDDGMSYEQSSTVYQDFSVEPVLITALAARGAGARPDPLCLKVRNNLSLAFRGGSTGDYDMPFYPVDDKEFPRPRTKNLHLALTAQFGLLRPDTTCPAIGDYGGPAEPSADSWMTELAWDVYGDRRAARLLALGGRRSEGAHIFDPHFLTLVFGRPLPKRTRFASKSTIYPQAGYAVLKSIEGDGYWRSGAIQTVLKFGPYGNGHGHADKLHLDICGAGGKCCIEELQREAVSWRYWNSTVSHNTVVVVGRSQPGDEAMFALNDSCGRLVARRFGRNVKFACAEADRLYSGMKTYRRTVAVTDSYIVDLFEVAANRPTVFDWFLHGMGALSLVGVRRARRKIGYHSHGYQYLKSVRAGKADGVFTARFSQGHAVFFPAAGRLEVFAATGPWKKDRGRPALIVRKRGRKAIFLCVHDPSGRNVRQVSADAAGGPCITLNVKGRGIDDTVTLAGLRTAADLAAEVSLRRRPIVCL